MNTALALHRLRHTGLSDCGASAGFGRHCRRSRARCQALPAKPMRCRGASRCCPGQARPEGVSSRVVRALLVRGWSPSVRGLSRSAWSWSRLAWGWRLGLEPFVCGIPLTVQLVLEQEELALGLRIPVPPLL